MEVSQHPISSSDQVLAPLLGHFQKRTLYRNIKFVYQNKNSTADKVIKLHVTYVTF